MSEYIEWQQLHELLKELAQKEYGDKYGEQIFWYFQDVIDANCKLDVLEEENARLNNIINELEKEFDKELENLVYREEKQYTQGIHDTIINHKHLLQELKGSDKE